MTWEEFSEAVEKWSKKIPYAATVISFCKQYNRPLDSIRKSRLNNDGTCTVVLKEDIEVCFDCQTLIVLGWQIVRF